MNVMIHTLILSTIIAASPVEAGAAGTVSVEISRESLASFDESNSCWLLEKGKYNIIASSDAQYSECSRRVRICEEEVRRVENLFAADPLFL